MVFDGGKPRQVKKAPKIEKASNVIIKEPEWLVPGYIPRYGITTIAGEGGVGKTSIWCSLVASITTGKNSFLLGEQVPFNSEPESVLVLSAEDSWSYVLRARLEANGADLDRISYISPEDDRFVDLNFDGELLQSIVATNRPGVIVFDPLQAFVPANLRMGDRNAMRKCFSPLIGYGEKYGLTSIIIAHANKQSGVWGRKRIADSSDIWDSSRSVLMTGITKDAAFYIQKNLRACVENNRPVKLSRSAADEALQYKKLVREYTKYYGCTPSDRELCAFLHVDQDKLALIRKATETGHIRSLSEELPGMDGDICLGDTIASDEDLERDAIRRIDHEHMKRELWLAVDQLPDRLPAAIRLRYESGLTYKEMGERLGVDMNQARSLEQKAFKKLRIPSRAKRFRAYHEEYLSASQIHHVGVRRFNETWTSEVEGDAIRWTEKERGC